MSKIIVLDPKTNRTLGTLNNRGKKLIYSNEYIREMEGQHSFTFAMPSDIPEANHFSKRGRFLIPAEEKGFEEFVVFNTRTTMNKQKTVVGIAAYTELDTAFIVNPGTYTGTLQEIASMVLPVKRYQLGKFEDFSQGTVHIEEHIGAYAFLVKVAKAFELELDVRIELGEGNLFAGRFVDFVKRIGPKEYKEIVFGKDLIDVEITEHSDQIATRLIAIGPTRESGNYFTSIVESEEAFQLWNDEGEHITRIYTPTSNDQNMTQERLDQLTQTELNKRIASVYDYKIDAVDIEKEYPHEKVRFGSPLRVKNADFNPPLYAEARVIAIRKSITGNKKKTYTIGEVKTFTEEQARRTFWALQHLYGVKLIKSETAPDGQPKTIWIDEGTPLNTPHTFNFELNEWEKFAPTSADEIGGLLVDKQYNGVTITPESGLVVDRTDGLVQTVMNATEGLSIESRPSTGEPFKRVFYADGDGNLTYGGILQGSTIYLGGLNDQQGTLTLFNSDGEPVAQLDGNQRGFDKLAVGELDAPNVVSFGDFTDAPLRLFVASYPINGVEPDDNNEFPQSWDSPLRTIGEALRRIPRHFRGQIEIVLAYGQSFDESINISGYSGGGLLRITNGSGHNSINGDINISRNLVSVQIERIRLNCTSNYGALQVTQSAVTVDNSFINGSSVGTTFGIVALGGSSVQVSNSQFNNVAIGGRASYGGTLTANNNTGSVSSYAWQAFEGGIMTGSGTSPTGAVGNTTNSRGVLTGNWDFPAPPAPPAPTPVTQTQTWEAGTASGMWRGDYNGWDSNHGNFYAGKVGQGAWGGFGPFTGIWIFPASLTSTLSGKSIKQIRVFLSRISGGVNASQTAVIRAHGHGSRPAGKPSIGSAAVNTGIVVGQGKWVTLPASFHAGFANGSIRGFGVNGSQYMIFDRAARIEVTYE